MKFIFGIVLSIFFVLSGYAQKNNYDEYRPIPFTQKDRDMLIELNVKVTEMDKRNEQRINELDRRITEMDKKNEQRFNKIENELKELIYWIAGILFSMNMLILGFIIWDRRSFMRPLEQEVQKTKLKVEILEKQSEKNLSLLDAIKELAKTDEKVKQVLKQFHLL